MKKKVLNVLEFLLILIISIMIVGSIYYRYNYGMQDFEELIFYAQNGIEHTSDSVINSTLKVCIVPLTLVFTFLYLFGNIYIKVKDKFLIKIRKKEINAFKICYEHKKTYIVILFVIALVFVVVSFKIHSYIWNKLQQTNIYDNYYVNGENIKITFPEEKRNLIMIIAESMENTICSHENGGVWEYQIIPELEELALNNINFSNTEELGGAKSTYGATFTTGGLVATTSGIPLITHTTLKNSNEYKGTGEYLKNVYSLGDVLQKESYNLEMMMGSDGNFGGRTEYFTANGNYKIFDLNYAIDTNKMKRSEYTWWGFEDDKLFKWAKEEILDLASQEPPFNLIMLTADTHFADGYLSQYAEEKFDSQYENVFAYSSKLINDFVTWIQNQDFYKNTTIVILGDHLGMQEGFYNERIEDEEYERTVYNAFINSAIEAKNTKNREFTATDLYPTILASIGVKIENERLGLGTNLFSEIPTLAETLGYEYLNNELKKTSLYYNQKILGEEYYVIKRNEQQ